MIKEWFDSYYIVYALVTLCGLGLLIKLITNLIYIRLVRASSNMSSSKNKLVQLMKLKFETFYKLKIGVNNVDIFVDKYVYKYKICGLLLSTWENISGLMLILCLLIAPVASIFGLILNCGEKTILYTFFSGVCTSALLILVDNLFNIPAKRQMIKVNMKDYLENYLKARLEHEAKNPEAFNQYRTEMATTVDKPQNTKKSKKEERYLEKERKEREKFLELEAKHKEREERKNAKIASKEAEQARKEEEKRRVEEERRLQVEMRAEQKRKAIEEKKEKERLRQEEKAQKEELARQAAEEKKAAKRENHSKKLEEKEQQSLKAKEDEAEKKQEVNRQISATIYQAKSINESAVAKETKKKGTNKQTKMQAQHERLKEEIQGLREQREKERQEGIDPFDTYKGTKKVENPKNYKVNDFNMEYEMRVKAAQREEAKIHEQNASNESAHVEKAPIATAVLEKKSAVQLRGNSPSEDKIIDDFLKEFLA